MFLGSPALKALSGRLPFACISREPPHRTGFGGGGGVGLKSGPVFILALEYRAGQYEKWAQTPKAPVIYFCPLHSVCPLFSTHPIYYSIKRKGEILPRLCTKEYEIGSSQPCK
jgi:hypothetical protein